MHRSTYEALILQRRARTNITQACRILPNLVDLCLQEQMRCANQRWLWCIWPTSLSYNSTSSKLSSFQARKGESLAKCQKKKMTSRFEALVGICRRHLTHNTFPSPYFFLVSAFCYSVDACGTKPTRRQVCSSFPATSGLFLTK